MSRTIARGWATVELERAVRELQGLLRAGAGFVPVPRSAALGARCVRGPAASTPSWIVVLEPDAEGILAGFLARHGEGWAATWLREARTNGRVQSLGSPGPFGPELLEANGPRWGPYRLRVPAATIDP